MSTVQSREASNPSQAVPVPQLSAQMLGKARAACPAPNSEAERCPVVKKSPFGDRLLYLQNSGKLLQQQKHPKVSGLTFLLCKMGV